MKTTQEREERIRGWLAGRLPGEWFTEAIEITIDREEITVVGRLAAPTVGDEASAAEKAAAESGRIKEFRERTRDDRIGIARELEHGAGRKVAWGATCGDTQELFTTLSVPVMTRLRQAERQVLDTLVDSGVARTRSEALAWCVKLVGRNTEAWLGELRQAMAHVEEVRSKGPDSGTGSADNLEDSAEQ
ncbi:hypothetical protein [Tenggerimyces flavus]|uniref:Uncharacterized protein n=1 Tax=Tenggerimyces flavus TaxID=1708749 RepID=A0ABV7Y7Y6_9ACTN|nr:hypothetical protein [Tenggerimyces flavus]MBM7791042.1 hypothetical protein [Tenggerimyces flavus]